VKIDHIGDVKVRALAIHGSTHQKKERQVCGGAKLKRRGRVRSEEFSNTPVKREGRGTERAARDDRWVGRGMANGGKKVRGSKSSGNRPPLNGGEAERGKLSRPSAGALRSQGKALERLVSGLVARINWKKMVR